MHPTPDAKIRCLIVQPEFPDGTFWNYKAAVATIGAKTPNAPLGLITVAALLPQQWDFRLVDLNCRALSDDDWAWADLVAVGGMLPQQRSLLEVVRAARARGKFVVVGGSDPSSQPEIYAEADARVLDEGEITIPQWIDSWRAGKPAGIFRSAEKPDITTSPTPRYDLIDPRDYGQLSLQISRGCPFNCEFCDIIELFGRKPRIKAPAQVIRELEAILATGYRGSVDVVDDNFIGNKRYIRREILPELTAWNRKRRRPFFFFTEASMNLADDVPMMEEMVKAGFRVVFTGIETPDPDLLLKTQKSQNTVRPIQDRLRKMLDAGLMPTAGFIMGFDGEKRGMDLAMIQCIEDGPVVMAMTGLLVALPNTQLTRRLQKEGRLLAFDGRTMGADETAPAADVATSPFEISDQTASGLNFVTTRDRFEILEEFRNVVRTVYAPRAYMDRVLRMARLLKHGPVRVPRWFEIKREWRSVFRIARGMWQDPGTRWLFWRNVVLAFFRNANAFDMSMRMMSMYLHFRVQRTHILNKTALMKEVATERKTLASSEEQRPKEKAG